MLSIKYATRDRLDSSDGEYNSYEEADLLELGLLAQLLAVVAGDLEVNLLEARVGAKGGLRRLQKIKCTDLAVSRHLTIFSRCKGGLRMWRKRTLMYSELQTA